MHKVTGLPKTVRYITLGLAGVLLLAILACGGDDTPVLQATSTPQPTATPLDVGAIASGLQQTIKSSVDAALSGLTPAEGPSASEINRIVEAAVTAAIPDTASAEEIQALVETAVAASTTPGLSAGEITSLVSSAVASATAGQADPLTAAEVEAIVTGAIAAIPTATPQPTSTPAPTPTQFDPRRGGNPPLSTGQPISHFDPIGCDQSNSCLVNVGPVYNGLLHYDAATPDPDDISGDLAKIWTASSDGTSYTFTLDENARWHDGMPVTAADVVWSLERMVDPDQARPIAGAIAPIYESSTAVNDLTVEVTTKFAAATFLPLLALEFMKIMPKHHFEGMSEDDIKLRENVLGSGAFKFKDWDKDISFEHEKNDDYFKDGLPYWDGMKHFVIVDPGTATAAFKSGQVLGSLHPTNNLDIPQHIALGEDTVGKGTVHFTSPFAIIWLYMNTQVAPYDNPLVRRAIFLAIHRQPFVDTFGSGKYLIGSPFPPGRGFSLSEAELLELPGYRELDGEKHPDDIAEAKRLLDEAGVPGFKMVLDAIQIVNFVTVTELAGQQLRDYAGIDVDVLPVEFLTEIGKRAAGDYEIFQGGFGALTLDPNDLMSSAYTVGAAENYSNWRHDRIEEINPLQLSELNLTTRRSLIAEVETILLSEDSPYVFQYWLNSAMWMDNRIRNYNAPAGIYHQLGGEHFFCDPGC